MSKLVYGAVGVVIVLAFLTTGLSLWQINDEYSNSYIGKVDCDEKGIIPPFYATLSINGTTSEVQCSWSTTRSALRILYMILFIVISILCCVSLYKKLSTYFIILLVLIFCEGAFGLYCSIFDAMDSRDGHAYCKNTMLNKSGNVDCFPSRFYATVVVQFVTVIGMFVVLGISAILFSSFFKEEKYSDQKD